MSKICYLCGRVPQRGMLRSHSKIGILRRCYPNLQIKKLEGKKRKVCTSCLRDFKKVLA